MSFGVAAGAKVPYQYTTSYAGAPDSITVGTCGRLSARRDVDTATGRTLPALTMPIAAGSDENMICTCPAARSASATGALLYGTCVSAAPVTDLKNSPAR